jgi:copper binding plastocyanin/azurin family protein
MRAWIILLTLAGSLAVAGTSPAAAPKTITGADGPGFTITLKQRSKTVKLLAPGAYIFVIHDNSNIHNFHLVGPGVNKKTGVGATGTSTWHLTLRRGTYKFVCDPHATIMKGKFIVQTP